MAWSKDTKPLVADQANQPARFQLGMDLMYRNAQGNNIPVVYKGASSNRFIHTAPFEDGTKLNVHDSNLQLLDQPDFSNMPKSLFD